MDTNRAPGPGGGEKYRPPGARAAQSHSSGGGEEKYWPPGARAAQGHIFSGGGRGERRPPGALGGDWHSSGGGGGKYRPPGARGGSDYGHQPQPEPGLHPPERGGSTYFRRPGVSGGGDWRSKPEGQTTTRTWDGFSRRRDEEMDWRHSHRGEGIANPTESPAADMPPVDPEKPWHVQMLEKEFIEWNVPQHLRSTNDLVVGGVLIAYTIDKEDGESEEGGSANLINGKMSFIVEDKPHDILCSFLLVDSLATAESYQSCSLKVNHKRVAKAYFIGYNRSLCKYFVCYERLNHFSFKEDRIDHQQSSSEKKQQPKQRWRKNISEIFEALEALHVAGYGNNYMNSTITFAYGQGNDQDKLLKIVGGCPLPCDDTRTKKSQRVKFCTFLRKIGAENTLGYQAFKVTVQYSDNVEVIMKHPYILASDKERVAAIEPLNERLYDLAESKRVDLNTSLKQNFRDWVWQSMVKKSTKFSVFLCSNQINWGDYDDSLVSLVRFLRNFVEHQRDIAIGRQIDYTAVNKAIEEVFPGFISWAYTYSYLFAM
ncbi:uncharacterized protein LOC127764229 [Oryza glaberrima]|uniref:uncharacterized protein LOC127764229 n=1 Tax=Oryza glaberrima TaxID=4538 RepID=UPI00224C47B4|nr:uncharacterized protein LOC127764229 [Oryza glaberrima]